MVVGSPGNGGAATTGSGAGGASSSGAVTSSSSGAVGNCSLPCGYMLTCCDGACVETDNDPFNCGGCGVVCPGPHPYCHESLCGAPTCAGAQPCPSFDFCCGTQCCGGDMLCCDSYGGPIQASPHCAKPENGTCPQSCYLCN